MNLLSYYKSKTRLLRNYGMVFLQVVDLPPPQKKNVLWSCIKIITINVFKTGYVYLVMSEASYLSNPIGKNGHFWVLFLIALKFCMDNFF